MDENTNKQSESPLLENDPGLQRVKTLLSFVFVAFLFAFPSLTICFNAQTSRIASLETVQSKAAPSQNEAAIQKMVAGYPIAKMSRYLAQQDPKVASFMIAIAKKESNWGKRRPVLNGKDCFNYWGFREEREQMGSGGHTCFKSPGEAVKTIGKRLNALVYEYNRRTSAELVVWKCGYSCDGQDSAGVSKWIQDVDWYYQKANKVLQ